MTQEKYLNLPQKDSQGIPYISYSQIKSWKEVKSFNLRIEGKLEYMLSYFMGVDFPDIGWAEFGEDVENAITKKEYSKFSTQEVETLKKVEPLDIHQHEVKIQMDGFYLKGYIDDSSNDFSHIRDYKTASKKSAEQYKSEEYKQLFIYAIGAKEVTGKYPSTIEVKIIERNGNAFYGGRDALFVGNEIWEVYKNMTVDKEKELRLEIQKVAEEIAEYYTLYNKLNK